MPPSARAVALGGAYAAMVGDEGTLFVNPAGLAAIRIAAVGFGQENGLYGTRLTTAALGVRLGHVDVGLGGMVLDLGGDSVLAPYPGPGGNSSTADTVRTAYNALAVGALTYRRGVFSIGGSVKYLREAIDTGTVQPFSATAMTGDIGAAITFFDIAAFGVSIQNLTGRTTTSDGSEFRLPRTTRVGLMLNFVEPQGLTRLLTVTEYVAPPGGDSYWVFGIEGGVAAKGFGVLGRVSYAAGRAPSEQSRVAYGGGVQLAALRVDYAEQSYGPGLVVRRFGIRVVP